MIQQLKIPTTFLIDFIQSVNEGVSEYQLLQFIEENHVDFFSSLSQTLNSGSVTLYKKHFYLFHQLYKLRPYLLDSGRRLQISGLNIKISECSVSKNELASTDGLCDFYLDLENLNLTDQQVSEMMDIFWNKYLAIEQKSVSIQLLGLENETALTLKVIKQRFNRLAHQYHPDKGGSKQHFDELKKAYQVLKSLYM